MDRTVVVPERCETLLPVPKQSFNIGAARVETSTRMTRKAAEAIACVVLWTNYQFLDY